MVPSGTELYLWWTGGLRKQMWSIACYPSYTPEGGVPRARRIFRRYLPAEILTYLIINFLWAGLSLCLISTLGGKHGKDRYETVRGGGTLVSADTCHGILFCVLVLVAGLWLAGLA